MPGTWEGHGLADFSGEVRYTRNFGYPGTIDEDEFVWLVFDGFSDSARFAVNGSLLGESDGPTWECEVKRYLDQRNRLGVTLAGSGPDAGLWGDVALEIRRAAFLRDIAIARDEEGDRVRVSGTVAGTDREDLELYLVVGRRTAEYRKVVELDETGSFTLEGGEGESQNSPVEVRVDLVRGGEVWYRVERSLD